METFCSLKSDGGFMEYLFYKLWAFTMIVIWVYIIKHLIDSNKDFKPGSIDNGTSNANKGPSRDAKVVGKNRTKF